MPVYVHVEDSRTLKEKMIMEGRYLKAVVEQSGHDGIDFIFHKYKIAHHHVHSTVSLGNRQPSSKAEWRRSFDSVDGDLQIVPRDVDLQYVFLEIPLLAKHFQRLIVLRRHLL